MYIIHANRHKHIHACIHTFRYLYLKLHLYLYVCLCLFLCLYHFFIYISQSISIFVYSYIFIIIYFYIYIYTYPYECTYRYIPDNLPPVSPCCNLSQFPHWRHLSSLAVVGLGSLVAWQGLVPWGVNRYPTLKHISSPGQLGQNTTHIIGYTSCTMSYWIHHHCSF